MLTFREFLLTDLQDGLSEANKVIENIDVTDYDPSKTKNSDDDSTSATQQELKKTKQST